MRDFVSICWRNGLLWALMFWQGGFLFYTSAVVPTAQTIIGHRQQGFITRHVTVWINNSAAVFLALIAVELAAFPDPRRKWRWLAWASFFAMVACQAVLFDLHGRLEANLDVESMDITAEFRPLHRAYLWVHTVQFGFAVLSTGLLVAAWRARDRKDAV